MEYKNISTEEPIPYRGPSVGESFWCPECGSMANYRIPVEPLYFLDEVYKLVPFVSVIAAKRHLDRHKDEYPPRWIRVRARKGHGKAGGARYKRVLSASDVRRLRAEMIRVEYE